MKVSVIIVSYNARYYLEQCLESVQQAMNNIEGEIIVFDNNSPEKPIEKIKNKFPKVQFIVSETNLGFAKANNQAVEMAKGEYVLILNPDTLLPENLFDEILPFADSKSNLGILGVRMIDGDGKFHPESKRNIPNFKNTFGKLFGSFFSNKNGNSYYKEEVNELEVTKAEILTGAFMLLKRDVYQKIGGFDEAYFMYGEDIDLSYTLILNDFENYYYGKTSIIHYKGESTRKDKKYLKVFFGAMHIFVDKYYNDKKIQQFIFNFGLKIRYLIARFFGFFKAEDKKERSSVSIESLQKISDKSEITENIDKILLDGSIFSNRQMIEFISKNHKASRRFFIKPKDMDIIIGGLSITKINGNK